MRKHIHRRQKIYRRKRRRDLLERHAVVEHVRSGLYPISECLRNSGNRNAVVEHVVCRGEVVEVDLVRYLFKLSTVLEEMRCVRHFLRQKCSVYVLQRRAAVERIMSLSAGELDRRMAFDDLVSVRVHRERSVAGAGFGIEGFFEESFHSGNGVQTGAAAETSD